MVPQNGGPPQFRKIALPPPSQKRSEKTLHPPYWMLLSSRACCGRNADALPDRYAPNPASPGMDPFWITFGAFLRCICIRMRIEMCDSGRQAVRKHSVAPPARPRTPWPGCGRVGGPVRSQTSPTSPGSVLDQFWSFWGLPEKHIASKIIKNLENVEYTGCEKFVFFHNRPSEGIPIKKSTFGIYTLNR